MKKALISLGAVIAFVVLFYAFNHYIYTEKQGDGPARSHMEATYVIDGRPVRLLGGVSEAEAAPGSASKITTKHFGNEVNADLDGDGREDVVFLLTQDAGGSGTFFYVVAALNRESGYEGSQAFLLGDRIAPQTTHMSENPEHKNVIVVNYAERKPGDPMTAQPSVGKSVFLKLDPGTMQFGEVVQDFEGEADPSRMTLPMKTWIWESALSNDGRETFPKKKEAFTLTFSPDGSFTGTTDCNSVGGSYGTRQGAIMFSDIFATKMFCEGSQEAEFTRLLSDAVSYHFTPKGKLILDLKFDSGSVTFR